MKKWLVAVLIVVALVIVVFVGFKITGNVPLYVGDKGPCAVDFNEDGIVDIQDFGMLRDNFGIESGANFSQGDANEDGMIDIQDFGLLKDNFGQIADGCTVPPIYVIDSCTADINHDGIVNSADMYLVGDNLDRNDCALVNRRCNGTDVNQDGGVDIQDLGMVKDHLNETAINCPDYVPPCVGGDCSFQFEAGSDTYLMLNDFPFKDAVYDLKILYGDRYGNSTFYGVGSDSSNRLAVPVSSYLKNLSFNAGTDSYFVASNINTSESYLMKATNFKIASGTNKTTIQYRKADGWATLKEDAAKDDTATIGNVGLTIGKVDYQQRTVVIKPDADVSFTRIYARDGRYMDLPTTDRFPRAVYNFVVYNPAGTINRNVTAYWDRSLPTPVVALLYN